MRHTIQRLSQFVGQVVTIKGWVYNLRSSGPIIFLQMRDGTGFAQAVLAKASVDQMVWDAASSLTLESSCVVTGIVTQHPKKA